MRAAPVGAFGGWLHHRGTLGGETPGNLPHGATYITSLLFVWSSSARRAHAGFSIFKLIADLKAERCGPRTSSSESALPA